MKSAHIPSPDPSLNRSCPQPSLLRWLVCAIITLAAGLLAVPSAQAQGIRFQFQQVRVTVPVNSTTSSVISNTPNSNPTVVLVNGVTNAIFDISGLPANTSATLTDTNGNLLPSIDQSTNVLITVNTTNLPEGIYTFNLNASGTDTNGVPVTNTFPFVLQSAYIWNGGGYNVSNNWATAASWVGGVVPGSTDDAIFGNSGAQTNAAFTNMGVDINTTIGSMRFAQSTNGGVYNIKIGNGATLAVTGTNGFSLLRDQIGEFGLGNNAMTVNFINTNAGTVLVSNANANFGILLPNGINPTLNFSNLATLVTYVSRMGLSDFQIYPNYRALNDGYNGDRDTNSYSGIPRQFWSSTFLARTNFITALYADPNNYTNEFTRGYSLMFDNSEQQGDGSGTATAIFLGNTNIFNVDSICFVGANSSASGVNNAGVKFQRNGSGAVFRGTNGGRMSVFTISDDGGTNQANSNLKAAIDFSGPTNSVSILADRFYIARDRTMIKSNQSPNVQGDFTMGAGTVDVNTAVLGFQEHSNKTDWPAGLSGAQAYLNYCQGRVIVTNSGTAVNLGGTFKVNGNLTLGYTADSNPVGDAQQFNTFGRITIYTNATVIASNIICDGGLNFYDSNGRQNQIIINQGGNLVISNTCGFPSLGAADFSAADPNGMRLDNLTIAAGKLTLIVDPSRTNVFVRSLSTPGLIPGVIKVAALTGVTSFPVQIPVISYTGTASPFLNADVTALGAGYFGYVLNNDANKTVDVYITTNAPNNLVWTGGAGNSTWDTTSLNWALVGTATATNFNLGDLVTFNDSSSFNTISVSGSVVPGQTGVGVTISNVTKSYTFSGGILAGTALIVKQGAGSLEFDSTEQGPINIFGGNITGNGGFGTVTMASNVVLNFSGTVNGGLTSTGTVFYTGAALNGPVSIQGGFLDNSGTINTTVGQVITMASGTVITNEAIGIINVGAGIGNNASWTVPAGSTLANFGQINLFQPRITVDGLFFGNGTLNNPNNGGLDTSGAPPRLLIDPAGTMGIGTNVAGSLSTMNLFMRFDFNNDPTTAPFGVSTIWVDFDFANPQTNDIINCDRWNNDTGLLLFTNINPSAGTFQNGQVFTIIHNSNGTGTNNNVDTTGFSPFIQPYVPGPGLVWGVTNFNGFGTISVTTNSMNWDGVSSANWSTNVPSDTSWKSGQTFTPNMGAFFGDNAGGSTTVNISTAVMPAGERGTLLNSNQPNVFPGITVSNALKDYVFTSSGTQTGKITGITGIYKTGPGALFLLTTNVNDFSGNVIIEGGTLAVTNLPPGLAGGNAIVSLGTAGGGQMKNEVVLDGGTLAYIGTTNVQLGHHISVMSHNGTVQVTSATNFFLINNNVVGAGGLTKTGPGILAMNSGNNNYQAGTTVNGGTLRLFATSLGSGNLTMAANTSLELTNNFTLTNSVNFGGAGIALNILGNSADIVTGPWSGGGSITFNNTNLFVFNNGVSNFTGSISFGSTTGSYRLNNSTNSNPNLGSAAASFDLGTGASVLNNMNGGGLTYNLGSLAGGPNTVLAGRLTNSAAIAGTTYSIGANGNDSTFNGRITNGQDTVTVVKVGAGQLLLNGINTYTGSTTVSNGILGGSGSLASPLTVTANGEISPGASLRTIGTFAVSNNVTLNGTVLMELNGGVSDRLIATGTLTGGGSLLVSNIGPDIVNGTVFHLFNKGVTGFTTEVLPPSSPTTANPYSWEDDLAADGTIKLLSGGTTVNTNPTNIAVSVSGNVMTLSWPPDYQGWQLLSNSVDITLSNFWFPVAGSTATTQQNLTIDTSKTNVFFRMIYPPLP